MPLARRCCPAITLLVIILANGAITASGQQATLVNDPLKGLKAVSVAALNNTRPGGIDTAAQSDVESRLRAAGIQVLAANAPFPGTPESTNVSAAARAFGPPGAAGAVPPIGAGAQQAPKGAALLQIETVLDGSAVGINVTLSEGGILLRDFSSTPPVRVARVTVWQRHYTVQGVSSAQETLARLESDPYLGPSLQEYRRSGYMDPVMRGLLPTIVDLEVKATQRSNPEKVQEYIRGFMDEFVNEWVAANPKSR